MTGRERDPVEALETALRRIQGIADADTGRFLGDYGFQTIKDGLYEARLAGDALAARVQELEAALREERTRHHSLRWTLGLETHEGEEPQSQEDSIRNLLALRAEDAPDA